MQRVTHGIGLVSKLIFYALLLAAGGWLLWRYQSEIRAAVSRFWQDVRDWWQRLFGRRTANEPAAETAAVAAPHHVPFAAFADPFQSGLAQRASVNELVRYSFEALEAWSADLGRGRRAEETPVEFTRSIGERHVELARQSRLLGELYSRLAYSDATLPANCVPELQRLWGQLRRRATRASHPGA